MKTLLIADDSAVLCESLARYFESRDYNVIRCYNGRELIEANFNNPGSDSIITNIKMPVMNGIEAITEIRKRSNIYIIAITGYQEQLLWKDARKAGADAIVDKSCKDAFSLLEWLIEKKQTIITNSEQKLIYSDDPELRGLTKTENKIITIHNDSGGKANICQKLGIKPNTLKKHMNNIYSKGYIRVSQITRKAG
jgi:DNA-binding NarL/FixJ family response regulator